jgi:hypothetical protein
MDLKKELQPYSNKVRSGKEQCSLGLFIGVEAA